MIQTSYFARYKGDNGISIARYRPSWATVPEYPQLAPTLYLLNAYKEGNISIEEYEEMYRKKVLSVLDPRQVAIELDGKVLLCWEITELFCHRKIVSKWFTEKLRIAVPEVVYRKNMQLKPVKHKLIEKHYYTLL